MHARLRQPEGTAAVRHQCMEKTKVKKYFHELKAVLDEHRLHVKPSAYGTWSICKVVATSTKTGI